MTLGENITKPNFTTDIGMIDRSWGVARTQTNPTMQKKLDIAQCGKSVKAAVFGV